MKIKWFPVTTFSMLSLALAALGFGSCQSKKFVELRQKHTDLQAQYNKLNEEAGMTTARLAQLRNDYENIGQGECVYGGPNNMEEAVAMMRERQNEQRAIVNKEIEKTIGELDSLHNEMTRVEGELNAIDQQLNKKR